MQQEYPIMGRLPKIRVSYFNDAQYMLRLIQALEMDKTRPEKWRKRCIQKLQDLADDFMHAPSAEVKKVA
jgi:hypothetical protein